MLSLERFPWLCEPVREEDLLLLVPELILHPFHLIRINLAVTFSLKMYRDLMIDSIELLRAKIMVSSVSRTLHSYATQLQTSQNCVNSGALGYIFTLPI
jgi:hypothetical protein